MNVDCPQCKTVFRIDPRKVGPSGVRARCSICGGVFEVSPNGEPETVGVKAESERGAAFRAEMGREEDRSAEPGPAIGGPGGVGMAPSEAEPGGRAEAADEGGPDAELPGPAVGEAAETHDDPAPQTEFAAEGDDEAGSYPERDEEAGFHSEAGPGPGAFGAGPGAEPAHEGAPEYEAHEAEDVRPETAEEEGAFPFGQADPASRSRRLARALISDMVAYHPERQEVGLREGRLKELFRDEIKKAWREYVDQVGLDFAKDKPYFRDALNDILARGNQVF